MTFHLDFFISILSCLFISKTEICFLSVRLVCVIAVMKPAAKRGFKGPSERLAAGIPSMRSNRYLTYNQLAAYTGKHKQAVLVCLNQHFALSMVKVFHVKALPVLLLLHNLVSVLC